ncbi:hypothetical protein AB0K18_05220 [Nonomuraea sp. NPDC049421]|uniref:hypothetical protein n=1 Tax=Nonomuraea sp. NPDC049421 TaxID=3155275 RepID=UPI003422305C
MPRVSRLGAVGAALAVALCVAPAAATAQAAPARQACGTPSAGWVHFYESSGCGGAVERYTVCEWITFGYLYNRVSSYWDRQTGGAYARVYDSNGSLAFRTYPNTGVRDLATWENDRSATARIC